MKIQAPGVVLNAPWASPGGGFKCLSDLSRGLFWSLWPLKKLQRKGLELPPPPGAPNSTWKLLELKLWMKLLTDRVTQHVPSARWRIYIYIYIFIYLFKYIYV